MRQETIQVTVNGKTYCKTVNVSMTLLEFLRQELHLTGAKQDAMRVSVVRIWSC